MIERLLVWLAWLAADPAQIDAEPPKAAAAVAVARASMTRDTPAPTPTPTPDDDDKCCSDCGGTGEITQPDGHVTPCPCPVTCPCKQGQDPPLVPVKQPEQCIPATYWVDPNTGVRYRIVR